MQNNNNTRGAAIKWWNTLSEKEQLNFFTEYAQINFTPANMPSQLTGREVEAIYKSEHPEQLNKEQGTEDSPENDGYILFSEKRPPAGKIRYWYDGEKTGTYEAEMDIVIELGRLPKMWKPIPPEVDLLDGITLGEWIILWGNYTHFATINADTNTRICAIEVGDGHAKIEEAKKNALLIAGAPQLAAENKALKEKMEVLIKALENILFEPVGNLPYRLKKVEIVSPLENVSGLIKISGEYYNQVIDEQSYKDFMSKLAPPLYKMEI